MAQIGKLIHLPLKNYSQCLTLYQTRNFCLFQIGSLQTTILKLMRMAENFQRGRKYCGEKEKFLDMSNFFFSRSVFKRPVLQTRKNQCLFGKGLSFFPVKPTYKTGQKLYLSMQRQKMASMN